MGEDLFALVTHEGKKKILVNFGNIEYFSSSSLLGKFIILHKMVKNLGGKLVLCGIPQGIYEVFEMTKLDRFFNCQSDLPSGVVAF